MEQQSFLFGIYLGGVAGIDNEVGLTHSKADKPDAIRQALDTLQGERDLFIVRNYLHFKGEPQLEPANEAVQYSHQYCGPKRKLDLVLCFQTTAYSPSNWQQFISHVLDYYGPVLHSLQIAEEPNMYQFPGDGAFPQISQVIVNGVIFAKQAIHQRGLNVQVGFNAVPCFDKADPFWTSLGQLLNVTFLDSLDYVGLDFFPDVFRPIDPASQENEISQLVKGLLQHFRNVTLSTTGIDESIPIRITEHGWPTGPSRSAERQAYLLNTIIRSIYASRRELNITHYELFSLRDADSENPNLFYQFGLLEDDYSAKHAFYTYQQLIKELSS
ncbi:hypothetical protein GCM10027592_61900 [Spirosoma flavus]